MCKRCGDFGHFIKTYKEAKLGEDGERGQGSSKRYYNYFCVPFCSNLSLAKTNKVTIVFAKQEEANRRLCWTFLGEEEEVSEEED